MVEPDKVAPDKVASDKCEKVEPEVLGSKEFKCKAYIVSWSCSKGA